MSLSILLLVLLGAGLHATWNGLVKAGSDRYLDIVALLAAAAVLTALWLPFLPLPAQASWLWLALSAVIHQLYFALIALSYQKGDMSLVYPVTRGSAPALTALASILWLGERPSMLGLAGVCLVSCGVLMFACERPAGTKIQWAPLLPALANACVIVLYTMVDGTGVRLSGHAFSYTSWGFLLCALLFVPTALVLRRRRVLVHIRERWRSSLIGAGCSIGAYGLALWAMTRAPIATVAALRETAIVFGVIIAACTLKERLSPIRIAAGLVVVAGAVIIKLG